jgi:acyl carrier protein
MNLRERLIRVISEVLDISPEEAPQASIETTENWDSIRAMMLVASIEEEFGVHFTDDEYVHMMSYSQIEEALAGRGIA